MVHPRNEDGFWDMVCLPSSQFRIGPVEPAEAWLESSLVGQRFLGSWHGYLGLMASLCRWEGGQCYLLMECLQQPISISISPGICAQEALR